MRRMRWAVVVFAVTLVAFNVGVHGLTRQTQRIRLLRSIDAAPRDVGLLNVGNSLARAGYSAREYEKARQQWGLPRSLDIALGATSPVEHALLLEYALGRLPRVSTILYGYFDDQLGTEPSSRFADLIGNRAIAYRFADQAAALFDPGSWLTRAKLRLFAAIPMVADRTTCWIKVDELRRRLAGIGMPRARTNRFGRAGDFGALELEVDDFRARARRAVRRQSLSRPVQAMLRMARRAGARMVVVEMPMTAAHRRRFYATPEWRDLARMNRRLVEQAGGAYLSAADWVGDEGFEDAVHLGRRGAEELTRKMGRKLGGEKRGGIQNPESSRGEGRGRGEGRKKEFGIQCGRQGSRGG